MKKRFLSLLMVFCMLITCMPTVGATGSSNPANPGLSYRLVEESGSTWVLGSQYYTTTPIEVEYGEEAVIALYLNGTMLDKDYDFEGELELSGIEIEFVKAITENGARVALFAVSVNRESASLTDDTTKTSISFKTSAPDYAFYDDDSCDFGSIVKKTTLKTGVTSYPLWFSEYENGITFKLVDANENDVDASIAAVTTGTASNGVMPITVTIKQMPTDEICLWAMKNGKNIAEITLDPTSGSTSTPAPKFLYTEDLDDNEGEDDDEVQIPTTGHVELALFYDGVRVANKGDLDYDDDLLTIKQRETQDSNAYFYISFSDIHQDQNVRIYHEDDTDRAYPITFVPVLPEAAFYTEVDTTKDEPEIANLIEHLELIDKKEATVYCCVENRKGLEVEIDWDADKTDAGAFTLNVLDADPSTSDIDPVKFGGDDGDNYLMYTCKITVTATDDAKGKLDAETNNDAIGELNVRYYASPEGLSYRAAEKDGTSEEGFSTDLSARVIGPTRIVLYLDGVPVTDLSNVNLVGCELEPINNDGAYELYLSDKEDGAIKIGNDTLVVKADLPVEGFYTSAAEFTLATLAYRKVELPVGEGVTLYFHLDENKADYSNIEFSLDDFKTKLGSEEVERNGETVALKVTVPALAESTRLSVWRDENGDVDIMTPIVIMIEEFDGAFYTDESLGREIDEGYWVDTTRFGYELADETANKYPKTFPAYFYVETEASNAPAVTFAPAPRDNGTPSFTVAAGTPVAKTVNGNDGWLYPLTLTVLRDEESGDGFTDMVDAKYNGKKIASGCINHWFVKDGLSYRELFGGTPDMKYFEDAFTDISNQSTGEMAIGKFMECALYFDGVLVTDSTKLRAENAELTVIDAAKGLYKVTATANNGRINYLNADGTVADYLEIGPQVAEDNTGNGGTGSSDNNSSNNNSSSNTSKPAVDTSKDTTTATPNATVKGDSASANVSNSVGKELIEQANKNDSSEVVIAPEIKGEVNKTEVKIPANTVGNIGQETDADLTVSTPVADITLPNDGLGDLAAEGGSVEVKAERDGNTIKIEVVAGKETVDKVGSGMTVTVPMDNATSGTVAVIVHADGTREVIPKSVAADGSVTIPLDGSATIELVDNSKDFNDVPDGAWNADAVDFVSARGLFSGTGDGNFSPEMPMSRGMIVTVLHNLESNPASTYTGSFADVADGAWYAEGAKWAAENGIATGLPDGSFGANENISREEFAVMLWRYAGSPKAEGTLDFVDAADSSAYAQEALLWAVENGVMSGKAGIYLDPKGEASRAEVAQMLRSFMENI